MIFIYSKETHRKINRKTFANGETHEQIEEVVLEHNGTDEVITSVASLKNSNPDIKIMNENITRQIRGDKILTIEPIYD